MPGSKKAGKAWIVELYQALGRLDPLRAVLDIGPGAGTYAKLLRRDGQIWTAVEVWGPYVERYALSNLYDRVIVADARVVDWCRLGPFDVGFCGDVLEHMTKDDALDLLARLLERCRIVVISIPIKSMPQGSWEGNPFETHVKDDWSHAEARASFPFLALAYDERPIGIYVLARATGDAALLQRLESELRQPPVNLSTPE